MSETENTQNDLNQELDQNTQLNDDMPDASAEGAEGAEGTNEVDAAFDESLDNDIDNTEVPKATTKKAKEVEVVDYKLEQTDDQPRDDEHGALTIPGIKEMIASGQDWRANFDPQTGILGSTKEKATTAVPSKMFTCVPDVKGTKKDPKPVIVNGVQQYKPVASVRTFPVQYEEEYVEKVLGGIFNDAVSKYLLDQFLKPFNKLVQNEHYGRKMPVRTFNAPFKISLAAIAETSGVTFEEHLQNLLRSGWFKKSASVRQFEMSVMCDTPEQLQAILAQKGKMIMEWKPADFPQMMGTVQVFKRVGKIVSENFTYKGRAPLSAQMFAVLDCINAYTKPYADKLDTIEEAEQEVEAGNLPPEAITPNVVTLKQGCVEQLAHWATVSCGIDGLAKELQKAEEKKLAKVTKADTGIDTGLDSLESLGDLEFLTL